MSNLNIETICALPGCDELFVKRTHNHLYHSKKCKRQAESLGKRKIVAPIARLYKVEDSEEEQLDEGTMINYLRAENKRLANAVAKYKLARQDMVETLEATAREVFTSFQVSPAPKPTFAKSSSGDEEVAVAVLADWQLGKVTPTYDSQVCADRIDLYGDEVIRVTNIQRKDHPVKHLRVWILGDIVEGEDIFPGQANEIDSSLYVQVGVNGPKILGDFLNKMLAHFETVHVVGVIGNHGTLTGGRKNTYNNETNMDRLLYKIMEWIFQKEDRITFHVPDGYGSSSFYAVDEIGNYSTLLLHGNQFASPTSIHSYFKKIMGWKDGAIPERFDDIAIGHWHHNMKMTLGSSTLRIVGSPESHNEFAQEKLGAMSPPTQHLQFVNPKTGVTSECTILLEV